MKPKNCNKKYIVLTAALSAIGLTAVILAGMHAYAHFWTPFEKISIKKGKEDTEILVEIATKVPVKSRVEYGTNPSCTVKTDMTNKAGKEHSLKIAYVIPNKNHFLRVIAETESGKEYTSDFLQIR